MIKKVKFTFPINESTYNLLKKDAEQMGISMSGYLNYLLAQHFNTKENMMNSLKDVIQKAINETSSKDA